MATTMAMESNDRLPLLSPSTLDPTERPSFDSHPPEYYAPRTQNQTQAPRNVRFQSPPTDTPQNLNDADAESLLPPYSPPAGSYRGHNSEAEYLAALRAWVEEKAFVQPHDKCALPGFYGKETMEECIAKNPELRLGRKKGRKGWSKGENGGEASRGEEAGVGEAVVEDLQRNKGASADGRRRKSSIGQWLSRKRTG